MTQLLSNIDGVRERIMQLESATVFDAMAWSQVLADLEAASRVSALADAKRRMKTARGNQPALALRKNGKTEMVIQAMIVQGISVEMG